MVTRTWISRWIVAVAIGLAPTTWLLAESVSWNHDPTSPEGPAAWGRIAPQFATCGAVFEDGGPFIEVGTRQSPIDISTATVVPAKLPPLTVRYRPLHGYVENTGHVVEVPYENGSTLRIGDAEYDLLQFHFHARSEHTIDGHPAPLEAHFVHANVLGELAVVGVMMTIASNPSPLVDLIFTHAPLEEGAEPLPGIVNARELLPHNTGRYFLYSGSLTTPPCSEGVRWVVLRDPVAVSQAAVDMMMTINAENNGTGYQFNHRPVRPLNGRTVLFRAWPIDRDDD